MPRIGVNTLRWLLLAGNCAALAGLAALAWDLFVPNKADQLRIALPDPASVAVAAEERTTFDAKDLNKILRVHKDQPRAKPEPRVIEPELPPVAAGGPLSGWEVAVAIVGGDGRFASLQEKVEQNIVDSRTARFPQANARTSGRGRPSRVRPAPRRAIPTAASRTKWVEEGERFTVDGSGYIALRVDSSPLRLEYQEEGNGLRHFITGAENPWIGYELAEGGTGYLLRGLEADELGEDPAALPTGLPTPVPPDERGEVRPTQPQPQARQPANQPNQPAAMSEERRRALEAEAEKQRAQELRETLEKVPEKERQDIDRALRGAGKRED